jgi:uncharacterized protein YbaP (TraB family)
MRRQIIVMFCSLLCIVLQPSWAVDNAHTGNRGALFKVSEGTHTLYLFGTIHVGAPDFYPLEQRVSDALKNASVLALEVDPLGDQLRIAQAVQRHGMLKPGAPASASQLSPAFRSRLARLLRQYRIAPEQTAAMKPWLLASLLTVSEFAAQGYDTALAVDAWLARQAHDRGQSVVELESVDGQMALFDKMSHADQLLFLEESIVGIEDKEQAGQVREIARAWSSADAAALEALAARAEQDGSFSGRFVQKVLLDSRNPALADNIAALLTRENNSLAAIGILHLVGTGSVPQLLARRGLSVERIY